MQGLARSPAQRGMRALPSAWNNVFARRTPWLRHSTWDLLLVTLALVHGALLLWVPSIWLIALGLWWNGNTVSHLFLHLPFFRTRILNRLFSIYLSLLLGFPQSLWRARHLAHHRGVAWHWTTPVPGLMTEGCLVLILWLVLFGISPNFFLTVYLPGWLAGLVLCQLQGHFEHHHGTISHYGRLYNWIFFNDGFHVEHHAWPSRHWTALPSRRAEDADTRTSRWPAVLRWLDACNLDGLERLVLRCAPMQHFVLRCHERAMRRLLPSIPAPRQATIVGGGLFPRTALVLQRLVPAAQLRIVDARADHLDLARAHVDSGVEFECGFYEASETRAQDHATDLLVIPLAFVGNKEDLYRHPPARHVFIHDWLWRKRGKSVVVSWLLLKRLNLVMQ